MHSNSSRHRSSKATWALFAIIAVFGVGAALFFWLLRPGSSNIVGRWYKDGSQVAPTPTTTGDRLLDAFDKSLNSWRCATADSIEFLSDGTFSASSKFFGSGAGRYELIDGNRIKIETPNGAVLWAFSVSTDVLTIRGEENCPETQWRHSPSRYDDSSTALPEASPTLALPEASPTLPPPSVNLVPYIFLVGENLLTFSKPLEPGWTVGIAYLGFENRSGQLVPSQRLENVQVSVETQEGEVYPGTLFYRTPDMVGGGKVLEDMVLGPSYIFQDSAKPLDPDPGIPPGLPIASTSVIHPVYGSAVTVSWFVGFRFAEAAHPTRIVLKSGQTLISGDLPASVPVGSGDPYEMAKAALRFAPAYDEAKSLSDLATRLMQINPKLQLAFESCTVADDPKARFRYYRIPYSATNSNSLDNEELAVPYGIWKENGNYIQAMARDPLIKVGPGQTAKSELQVYADANPQRFVLLTDAGVEMYTLGCPSTTAETYASPPTAIVAEALPSNTPRPINTPASPPTNTPLPDAVVNTPGDVIVLRDGPSQQFGVIRRYSDGTPIRVIGRNNDGSFLYVQTPDNTTGWMMIRWLTVNISSSQIQPVPEPNLPTTSPVDEVGTKRMDANDFSGGFRRSNGDMTYRQLDAIWIYGQGSPYHEMSASFYVDSYSGGNASLTIKGMDSEDRPGTHEGKSPILISVNGHQIFEGDNPLPDDYVSNTLEETKHGQGNWGTYTWSVRPEALRQGRNTLTIENLADSSRQSNPPFFILTYAEVDWAR